MKKFKLYLGTLTYILFNFKDSYYLLTKTIGNQYWESKHDIQRIKLKMKKLGIESLNFNEVLSLKLLSEVSIKNLSTDIQSQNNFELLILCGFCKKFKPLNCIEIGTFEGNTTYNLARNLPKTSTIFTFDLPLNINRNANKIGKVFKNNKDYNANIRLILDDSFSFNYSKLSPSFNLIYIDGDHSYDGVKKDTLNLIPTLENNGVIIWDDFDLISYKRTVEGILDGILESKNKFKKIIIIDGSKLLIAIK